MGVQEASSELGETKGRGETCGRTFGQLAAWESAAAAVVAAVVVVVVDQVKGSPGRWSWVLQWCKVPRSCRTEVISGHWLQPGGGQVWEGAGQGWCLETRTYCHCGVIRSHCPR